MAEDASEDRNSPPQIGPALRWGLHRLRSLIDVGAQAAPITDSDSQRRFEAELLLTAATGLRRTELIAWPERVLSTAELSAFRDLIDRRATGEPIAYILGQREFWSLPLQVSPATLIPRPETELLIEWALSQHDAHSRIRCADLGTGTGAIALALANERPNWRILAVDRSVEALRIASINKAKTDAAQVWLVQGDWLSAIATERLDLILTNPPYVAEADPHLQQGDPRFEPRLALVAGPDGLDAIRRIAAGLIDRLRPGGRCAIEHGWDQGEKVRQILTNAGLIEVTTESDLAGHERFSTARHPVIARKSARIPPDPARSVARRLE